MKVLPATIQDQPEVFKQLSQRPTVAWPTLILWLFAALLWVGSTWAAVQGELAYGWALLINAWATFLAFTVLHDAAHRAMSTKQWLNATMGQLSVIFLTPAPAFTFFRFVHMQHHRFTNEGGDKDPDYWVSQGPKWLLPIKWPFLDLYYYVWYIPRVMQRTSKERKEFVITITFLVLVLGGLVAMGWFDEFLLYHFLPARIAAFFLAFAFDFLPHHPHQVTGKAAPYQATNVRTGMEWLLTPVLLYQNYHLVHHLHPLVPFYRYIKVWRARQRTLLENEAAMVKPISSKLVSVEEYLK